MPAMAKQMDRPGALEATHDQTPIAVFSYNRPGHLEASLHTLSRCSRLEECLPIIFCDAAKDPTQEPAVEASRAVAEQWASRLGARLVLRERNLGLAGSIAGGVSELCREFGRVIVLEDDLLIHPQFLDYMLSGLDRYREAERVWQISGYMFPVEARPRRDAFFLPLTTTWGWATWDRAWRSFDPAPPGVEAWLADPAQTEDFDLGLASRPYSTMLRDRLCGKNDSWGILWWYALHRGRGLVLYPGRTLVNNVGFDGSGVHCGQGGELFRGGDDFNDSWMHSPPELPDDVAADLEVFSTIKSYLSAAQSTAMGAAPRSKGALARIFKRLWHAR